MNNTIDYRGFKLKFVNKTNSTICEIYIEGYPTYKYVTSIESSEKGISNAMQLAQQEIDERLYVDYFGQE